jgi:hypothetical protein
MVKASYVCTNVEMNCIKLEHFNGLVTRAVFAILRIHMIIRILRKCDKGVGNLQENRQTIEY